MSAAASRSDRLVTDSKQRQLSCARCGAPFACSLDGDCWCAAEPARLPLSGDLSEDCLCPACLRAAARTAAAATVSTRTDPS